MGTPANNAVHVGKESTYGTSVTPTRSFEAMADSFKREQNIIESVGMRRGMHTRRADRVVSINQGGSGSIELDFLTAGMGMLLEGAAGVSTAPVQVLATDAYDQEHESAADAPGVSYTIQVARSLVDTAGNAVFTHKGCVITGYSLSHEVDGLLVVNYDFDFQDVVTDVAEATAAYPDGDPFHWGQAACTVDSVATHLRSMEFSADLGMKTDRRYLRSNVLKKVPRRTGVPQYQGSIVADFEGLDLYEDFINGTIVPIVFTWVHTADGIEAGYEHEVTLTLAACQFTGESPEASPTDLTSQPLPFRVLDNGTDPAVHLAIRSTDTAF